MQVINLGLKDYAEVLQVQESLFNANLTAKEAGLPTRNHLILCQHPPVYTLGKSGKRENILVPDESLNIPFYHVNRGGDVTYHGPGQLVVYPIVDIDSLNLGVADYIAALEEVVIQTLKHYGLAGERIENAAGIWLRTNPTYDRKICAIGAKVSRHITMHGIAVNINTNLAHYQNIVACGLPNKGVTSLHQELNRPVDFEAYENLFLQKFSEVFKVALSI